MANCLYNKCKISTNPKFGRFAVAAEDIKAGELLLSEYPIVCGPYWDTRVNCLNCYQLSDTTCKKCKVVPLCWDCTSGHDPIECRTLQKLNLPKTFLIDNFDVVTPLRIMLLLYRYAEQHATAAVDEQLQCTVEEVLSMESHCAKREDTWIWQQHAKNVIGPLRDLAHIDILFRQIGAPWQLTDEFMQKICGILDVNTFEVRTPNFEELPVRGLYTQAALLAHDCIGNTFITVDNSKQLKVFASVDIKTGETIFNNYTATLYGTVARREHLMKGKYFECDCRRCIDPTELGTHLSSLKCPSCATGYTVQADHGKSLWVCPVCRTEMTNDDVQRTLRRIRTESHQMKPNIECIESFVGKYRNVLHPSHYLLVEQKQKLAALIRHMGKMAYDNWRVASTVHDRASKRDTLEKLLVRKIELCKELVPLLSTLQPGISRLKAIALYEQFVPYIQLAKLYHQGKSISDTEYLSYLCAGEELARESIRMLLYEPATSPEGMLAKQAMLELHDLRQVKQRLEKSVKRSKPTK